MTRNNRRKSRAMRRKQVEGMQATIDGLHAMHERARAREVQARTVVGETNAKLTRVSTMLEEVKRDLAAQLASRQRLIDSALKLVNMVRTECVGRPATVQEFAPRHIHPDQWRFMLQEHRFDAREFTYGNDPAKISLIEHTMYMLRNTPAVHDAINGQIHLRVRLGDGQAAYALSENAIYEGDELVLAERISEELAPMLVRELRGIQRDGHRGRAFSDPYQRVFGG